MGLLTGVTALFHLVVWFAFCACTAILLGAVYQALGTRRDRKRFPPPGRLVDLDHHRLHLLESGRGSPTIVLEAGLMSTVLSWSNLQRELTESYRVVSYDRAGLGWSDLGPMPRTADRIVDELHRLLQQAAIPPTLRPGRSLLWRFDHALVRCSLPRGSSGYGPRGSCCSLRVESTFRTRSHAHSYWR